MTEKQKIQLSKDQSQKLILRQPRQKCCFRSARGLVFTPALTQFAVLTILLIIFFIYATKVNLEFFSIIAAGLLASIIFLIPCHRQLSGKRSEASLRIEGYNESMNLVEAEMNKEKKAIDSFQEKIVNYAQLKGLTERLSMCLTLDDTSRTLSSEVSLLFEGKEKTIILYLFHSKTGELGISSSQKGQMRVNLKDKKGDEFDQWIVKTMQPLLIEDTKSDYRFDEEKMLSVDSRMIRSLISAPLTVGNKALGILRIDSSKEGHFSTEDLRFLSTIGDLGAVAIENAQLYERVEQLAIRDSITDLYLRRYLMDRLPEEIGRQVRSKNPLSMLMIDLDNFKQYNDKFGHVAGDIVLRTVGMILTETFHEPGNLICRYGGEEFTVLLPHCSKIKALELAEEFRRRMDERVIYLRRVKTKVTVSIGVATFPKDAKSKEELIQKADQALYKAKAAGRNKVIAV